MKSDVPVSVRLFHNKTWILLLLLPLCLLLSFFTARFVGGTGEMRTLRLMLVPVLAVLLPMMFFLRMEVCGKNALGARSFPLSALGRSLLFLLAGSCFFISFSAFRFWLGHTQGYTLYIDCAIDGQRSVAAFFAFAVLPALTEELFCRGLLLSHFRAYGILSSVSVCAAASALLFFPDVAALPFWFVFGILAGFLRLQSGSLFPSLFSSLLFRVALYFGASPMLVHFGDFPLPLWAVGVTALLLGVAFAFFLPDRKALSYLAGQIRARQEGYGRRTCFFLLFPLSLLLAAGLYLLVAFGIL